MPPEDPAGKRQMAVLMSLSSTTKPMVVRGSARGCLLRQADRCFPVTAARCLLQRTMVDHPRRSASLLYDYCHLGVWRRRCRPNLMSGCERLGLERRQTEAYRKQRKKQTFLNGGTQVGTFASSGGYCQNEPCPREQVGPSRHTQGI